MDRIRVGVVGLGWVSQVVHLPVLLKLPEAHLVAVCDKDRSKARLVADKFGIDRVFSDVNQMLETEDLHAVVVYLRHIKPVRHQIPPNAAGVADAIVPGALEIVEGVDAGKK